MKCSLDTRTKIVPFTIIFKLVPKFKLLHQSEVNVSMEDGNSGHFLYFIQVGLRAWPLNIIIIINANDMVGVVSYKSAKNQRNKKIMRSRSAVLPHYFAFTLETSL